MDNLIRVYDDVIDEESCQLLIEKFESFEDRLEVIYEKDEEERISFKQLQLVKFKEWESIQQGMLELFQDYIVRYKTDCNIKDKQWPQEYGYEAIRMKRYLNNDFDRFDPHVDVLDHHTSRRFLAFFIYVNDVEVGGETKFVNLNKEGTYIPLTVNPKRGRLLMFPPMWPWYHAGLKPESGKKYLIHSYCHYA